MLSALGICRTRNRVVRVVLEDVVPGDVTEWFTTRADTARPYILRCVLAELREALWGTDGRSHKEEMNVELKIYSSRTDKDLWIPRIAIWLVAKIYRQKKHDKYWMMSDKRETCLATKSSHPTPPDGSV